MSYPPYLWSPLRRKDRLASLLSTDGLTIVSSVVTAARDAGRNGITFAPHAGQVGLGFDTSTTVAGYPSLHLASGKSLLNTTAIPTASAHTIYVVAKVNSYAGVYMSIAMLGPSGAASSILGATNASGPAAWASYSGSFGQPGNTRPWFTTTGALDTGWHVLAMTYAADGSTRLYIDGHLCAAQATAPPFALPRSITAGLGFGSPGGPNVCDCNIAEVHFLDGEDTQHERRQMERYLASKYGLDRRAVVICVGPSTMLGTGSTGASTATPAAPPPNGIPAVLATLLGASVRVEDAAVGGSVLEASGSQDTRLATSLIEIDIDGSSSGGDGGPRVAVCGLWINDLGHTLLDEYVAHPLWTAAQYGQGTGGVTLGARLYARYRTWCTAARARGVNKILILDVLPQGQFAGLAVQVAMDREVAVLRALLALPGAAADLGADVVQIVGTDTLPLDGADSMQVTTNTNLWNADQLHPKGDPSVAQGGVYARVAALIAPTVAALLAS